MRSRPGALEIEGAKWKSYMNMKLQEKPRFKRVDTRKRSKGEISVTEKI
jgi:hypothetical protein